jgi:hypothetical protein
MSRRPTPKQMTMNGMNSRIQSSRGMGRHSQNYGNNMKFSPNKFNNKFSTP